ncbi:MAG: hypothetical protein U0931_27300 [Vulcanimicrobiota bacterium]
MRRFLADLLVAAGLVGVFVAIAGALGPHFRHLTHHSTTATATADYVGDWDCETRALSLHITGSGQQLRVTGLDAEEAIFARENDRQPFHEKDGERTMLASLKHLTVTLADGKEYGFLLRQ